MREQDIARRGGRAILGNMQVAQGVVELSPGTLQFHSVMPGLNPGIHDEESACEDCRSVSIIY